MEEVQCLSLDSSSLMEILLVAQVAKNLHANAGDLGSIPGLGVSHAGGHGNPLQYSCLENPQGQRSLVGYSPQGCKESDVTERPSAAQEASTLREKVYASGCQPATCSRGLGP